MIGLLLLSKKLRIDGTFNWYFQLVLSTRTFNWAKKSLYFDENKLTCHINFQIQTNNKTIIDITKKQKLILIYIKILLT